MVHSGLVFGLLVTGALAGCIGSEGTAAGPGPADPASAQPADFDDGTGAIAGLVTDTELVPLAGASLSILETSLNTVSAADGSFSFSRVPPGEHVLAVAKLGYSSHAVRINVEAGTANRDLRLVLEPIAVVEAYALTYFFKGYITCTVGAAGVLSEECGQGIATSYGTFGGNPNNKIDWKFNITTVQDLKDVLVELDWQPGSAAASKLTLYVAHKFRCTPSCDAPASEGGKEYCSTSNKGPPPLRCEIGGKDVGVKNPEKDLPWDMTARAWGAGVGATEIPNIVLEQPFMMYRTEFFGESMPLNFSSVPDT